LSAFFCASVSTADASRFFFSGDGVIALEHAHFSERVQVRYRDNDAQYDAAALEEIRRFFRSRDNGEVGEISLRLIELIDYIEDRYRPERMVLVSGYRSPELNEGLRAEGRKVAKSSLHTEGLAADLQFIGLDLKKLWIGLRELRCGGVGYYERERFLHLDTGRARFWQPQTSKVEQNLSAGNARVFARTDYDRYANLKGAVISLHSVTALPLRISRRARFVDRNVTLEPLTEGVGESGGCFTIAYSGAAYRFRIGDVDEDGTTTRERLTLRTCTPRVEATPAEVFSNPIEVLKR
jgi:uncharacterized protein YcbK (DUF882 family)